LIGRERKRAKFMMAKKFSSLSQKLYNDVQASVGKIKLELDFVLELKT